VFAQIYEHPPAPARSAVPALNRAACAPRRSPTVQAFELSQELIRCREVAEAHAQAAAAAEAAEAAAATAALREEKSRARALTIKSRPQRGVPWLSFTTCILAPLAVVAVWLGYGGDGAAPMARYEARGILNTCGIASAAAHEIVNQLTAVQDTGESFLVVQLVRLR
jgi:hypothetical protein